MLTHPWEETTGMNWNKESITGIPESGVDKILKTSKWAVVEWLKESDITKATQIFESRTHEFKDKNSIKWSYFGTCLIWPKRVFYKRVNNSIHIHIQRLM